MFARLRRSILGLSLEEATFARRGFRIGHARTCRRLEQIGATFLQGYHAALEDDHVPTLAGRLSGIDAELRGFAFEGAAMALTLLDHLMPWRIGNLGSRLQSFLVGPGATHIYMVHVGAGWAFARLPWRIRWPPQWLDPLLGWLAVDGYGFHQGYFAWPRYIRKQIRPANLSGYASRVFDQGLGRSLWFVEGANVTQIVHTIAEFAPGRHADLWSGVGLACAYAGGVDEEQIVNLRSAAGPYLSCLAQGAAFAAKARQRAANPTPHTDLTCQLFCGIAADTAANITDHALTNLPADGREQAYEVWRLRIQSELQRGLTGMPTTVDLT